VGGNTFSASGGCCVPVPPNKRSPTSSSRLARTTIAAREHEGGVLLPRNLLAYEVQAGRILPHYLGSTDERWIRSLIDELDALVGRTQGDADRVLGARLRGLALEHRVPLAAVAAVRHLLEKEWRHEVKAAAPPGEIRRVVFELAADPAILRSELLD